MPHTAIYPGTFDPITKGHLDIIQRACRLFDTVIIAIAINARKQPWISNEHRIDMITTLTQDLPQVKILNCNGLIVDFAKTHQAQVILRGMRTSADFTDEWSIATMNRTMDTQLETLFLPASAENIGVSASVVREIATLKGDISPFVPKEVLDKLTEWGYIK